MADRSIRDPAAPPLRARRPFAADQARPMRRSERPREPDRASVAEADSSAVRTTSYRRPGDVRRLAAAGASAVLPGAGQALNGRRRSAMLFAYPALAVLAITVFIALSDQPAMVVARIVPWLGVLLTLNVIVLAWRAISVAHAFMDRRYPFRPGRVGAAGFAIVLVFTAIPHLAAWSYGSAAQAMFNKVLGDPSTRSVSTTPAALPSERLNVLLIGVDSAPGRSEALTDSMIVVSLDPVGRTVSMLSIPRDLANVPLGDGNTFAPKLNSLMSYADRNKKQFPKGGIRTLEDAIGAMLGITIHYYAKVDLPGFAKMVDAVGGVDITVKKALDDPHYPGLNGTRGWSIEPGLHHFNGADALAYARIRKSLGETDLTRAARQQEVLVALRNQAVTAGIVFRLPALLDAVGATVRTDLPQDQLPQLAALAEQIGGSKVTKVVLAGNMIKGASSRYGSVFLPVPSRIKQMVKVVFGPPGADPTWPVPTPHPSATARPAASAP